jgi:hypothetical protein
MPLNAMGNPSPVFPEVVGDMVQDVEQIRLAETLRRAVLGAAEQDELLGKLQRAAGTAIDARDGRVIDAQARIGAQRIGQ